MFINKWNWCCRVAYALSTNNLPELEELRTEIYDGFKGSTRDSLSIMLWGCINEFTTVKLLKDYGISYYANEDLLGPNPTEDEWAEARRPDFLLKFNGNWIEADGKASYQAAKNGYDRDKNKTYNKCSWCLYPEGDNLVLHNFINNDKYILANNYRQTKKIYYEILLSYGKKM